MVRIISLLRRIFGVMIILQVQILVRSGKKELEFKSSRTNFTHTYIYSNYSKVEFLYSKKKKSLQKKNGQNDIYGTDHGIKQMALYLNSLYNTNHTL